jgi:protein ImuB
MNPSRFPCILLRFFSNVMRLWIGVHLPRLPLEVFRPHWRIDMSTGLAILERDRVLLADAAAHAAGVRAGLRRGGALALAPEVTLRERDAALEARALDEVALAMMQFSPFVAPAAEATVLMEAGASLRLFGGVRALRQRLRAALDSFGFTPAVSLAPTGQGAWLLARARGGRALSLASLERQLHALPLWLLPDARAQAAWFEQIGCTTLGELRQLPRAGLRRRGGEALLDVLDCALGLAPELYEWLTPPAVFFARIELPERVEHAEGVLFAARRLLVQLTGWLVAAQRAAVGLILTLEHERGREAVPPTAVVIALAEPAWQEAHLARLTQERLARLTLAAAVIAVRLEVSQTQAMAPQSDTLFPEPGGSPADHRRLVELLTARLGTGNVMQPAPLPDHRPEIANRWLPLGEAVRVPSLPAGLPRPVWLLESPVRLLMRRDLPFYGSPLRMVSAGERIETGWWDGHLVTRDYYVAQGEDQVCYWIYRERSGSRDADETRWYLHGLFG